MTENQHDRFPKWMLRVLALFLIFLTVVYAANTLLLIFAAGLGALFLIRTSRFIHSHTPLSRKASLSLLILVILAALVLFGLSIGPNLAEQISQLSDEWPAFIDQVHDRVQDYPYLQKAWKSLTDSTSGSNASQYMGRMKGFFSGLLGALSGAVLFLISALYMAFEPRPYRRGFKRTLTKMFGSAKGNRLAKDISDHLWGFLKGQLQTMTLLTVLTTVGLWLIGIPLFLALGVIAGLFAFVPVVGPIASVVPALVIALAESGTKALYVVILYGGIQLLESNLITPLIQKRNSELPPVLTLSVQGILGTLCGTLGLLVAAPLATVGMVAWEEWIKEEPPQSTEKD